MSQGKRPQQSQEEDFPPAIRIRSGPASPTVAPSTLPTQPAGFGAALPPPVGHFAVSTRAPSLYPSALPSTSSAQETSLYAGPLPQLPNGSHATLLPLENQIARLNAASAFSMDTLETSIPQAGPVTNTPTSRPMRSGQCFHGLRQVLKSISDSCEPLRPVMNNTSDFIERLESAAREDDATLQRDLEKLSSVLSAHFSGNIPLDLTKATNNIRVTIEEELEAIKNKEGLEATRHHLEANEDAEDIVKCYRRIQGHLEQMSLNVDPSVWEIVDKHAAENRLSLLSPSHAARHDSAESLQIGRRECTPETRKGVLTSVYDWKNNGNQGNMYWLSGIAGTGKTTIANSLCAMLEKSHGLGASFFCSRLRPKCRDVNRIFPTIAYQLACFSRPFYSALNDALRADPDLHTKLLSTQFEGLIANPLRTVADALPATLVIVIDALDECEDRVQVSLLLGILAEHASELPLKVFVSSRPEYQIRQSIGVTMKQFNLHNIEDWIVQEDIWLYLQTEFGRAQMAISEEILNNLVERAGVLFIYAATVVRYITFDVSLYLRPRRLKVVLEATGGGETSMNTPMDDLYSTILTLALNKLNLDSSEKNNMKLVLDTVVCAQEPLTVSALSEILKLGDLDSVMGAIEPLRSVLRVSGEDELVTTLHASFPDYMLDPVRSKEYVCRGNEHHGRLADLCLARISGNEQQFNVCGLQSSFVPDREVPDLEERVKKAIPLSLLYACRYWAIHLEAGKQSAERVEQVHGFISKQLLLWMEVLNLKNQISSAALMLAKVEMWCKKGNLSSEVQSLMHEAWKFAITFATGKICQSIPHLYVSMLASWPTGDSVRSVAISPNGMCIASGSADNNVCIWDATSGKLMMDPLEGHTSEVLSVAFSPCGMRIVSGAEDKTIRLWDATNGKSVTGSLEGHTGAVHSVAFSPKQSEMRIVSGSEDRTVRLWDSKTGEQVTDPLKGHTGTVNSVAFSPNGKCVASGSEDRTIRMWDAINGRSVLGPLEGHSAPVFSVAFSSDSTRLVSGSGDMTICVWDTTGGDLVVGPLNGHINMVLSVAFSPDDMRIVSGSRDNEIRVWDAKTGQKAMDPLVGLHDWVNSVTFSPDGMRIISGSGDETIRVWDATNAQPMMSPLKAHVASVNAVAFSPDGKRIATGCGDSSICLWDATTGELMMDPLEGHRTRVFSLAFSPDGTRIASGSCDGTILVWDTNFGQPAMGPLQEHFGSVSSITFSPDGNLIVSASHGAPIRVWDATRGELITELIKGSSGAERLSDGIHIPFGSELAAPLWGARNSNPARASFGMNLGSERLLPLVLALQAMRAIFGDDDGDIRMWDPENHGSGAEPVAGSSGSSLVPMRGGLQGGLGDISRLALGGAPMFPRRARNETAMTVSFSPDGTVIVSGSSDGSVIVWDLMSGMPAMDPLEGHTDSVYSVAFSPDGKHVASGSADNTIRVWDVKRGAQVMDPLEGHSDVVRSVAFSPDGTLIASGSNDNTIRVWNMKTGQLAMQPLEGHADSVNEVAFSPDGTLIVSGSVDATVRVWNISAAKSQLGSHGPSRQVVNRPWTLGKDGWVRDDQRRLLLWIPPDLQSRVLRSQDLFLISPHGTVELDMEGANIGESWVKCYTPA